MATSGSYDFGLTGTTAITAIMENLGVIPAGGTVSAADTTTALFRMQLICKQYQGNAYMGRGLQPYNRQKLALMLAKGQQSYLVGPASTDARSSALLARTTVDTAYASGTSLVVLSNTDTTTFPGTTITMANSDLIGVELNDGTIGWTTIASIAGAPTITLTAGFSVAAASGNYVYWFTSRGQRFPLIESATLRDENYNETPLNVYRTPEEYQLGVVDKYADGDPSSILVEPLRITTRVTLDSQPTDVTKQIILYVQYPTEDMDAAANDLALPQEWYGFIVWETTLQLAPAYQCTWTAEMEKNYQNAKNIALNLNPEVSNAYYHTGGL